MFVRSPDGALHRVVRHATTTETIAKLESIPSDYHLDCQCMLDNGEALTWIGDNRYRQVDGGKVYTAVRPQQAQGDARKQNPDAEPRWTPAARRRVPLRRLRPGPSYHWL